MKRIASIYFAVCLLLSSIHIPLKTAFASNFIPTITVDLSKSQGPVMHGATGFLYGMGSTDSPSANLLTPIKPYNSAQKAPMGLQHPTGDTLLCADTFYEGGGKLMMIYCQDEFNEA